ncbi:MAG: collagen-binding domain-containing protein [Bryobacteraceae bacterium]
MISQIRRKGLGLLAALLLGGFAIPLASATSILLTSPDASNFAVLYEGTSGHNLSITNVTINGGVGVGGTGVVQYSGPGTIDGPLDFSDPNNGQYHDTNGSNLGPTSVVYSDAAVTNALSEVGTLSSDVSGGTNLAISKGGETIDESSGTLETVDGIASYVFNVTSYSANNSDVMTIVGNGSGDPVIFNFAFNANVNLGGTVVLAGTGLTSADQVLFNFQSSGKNIDLNNNGNVAFQGIILAPNDALSVVHADLNGRVFGGDSSDMQIVSGDCITAPTPSPTPEPSSLILLGAGLLATFGLARSRTR